MSAPTPVTAAVKRKADDDPQGEQDFNPDEEWDPQHASKAENLARAANAQLVRGKVTKLQSTTFQDGNSLQMAVIDICDNVAKFQEATVGALRELNKGVNTATEIATTAVVAAHEARVIAASATRQNTKLCLILSGNKMPDRDERGEKYPITVAAAIIKNFLGIDVGPKGQDHIGGGHYQGYTNNFIVKFIKVGEGSEHERVLNEARKQKPQGFYAKVMESPTDSEMYFLLRCMKEVGEASSIYTARSGKPAAFLKDPEGKSDDRPMSFDSVQDIRQIMTPKSLKEEQKRIQEAKEERKRKKKERELLKRGIKRTFEQALQDEEDTRRINNGTLTNEDKITIATRRDVNLACTSGWPGITGNARRGRGRGGRSRGRGRGGNHGNRGGFGHHSRGGRGGGGKGQSDAKKPKMVLNDFLPATK